MHRLLCLLILVSLPVLTNAQASALRLGLWFDPARDGHGIDILRNGETFLIGLYTYDAQGEPEWFAAQGELMDGVFEAPLLRFRNRGSSAQPDVIGLEVGRMRLRPGAGATSSACQDGIDRGELASLADLQFDIDGEAYRWCIVSLLPSTLNADAGMNGTWWGGPDDSGWGLTTYFITTPDARVALQAMYHFDAEGAPRWSIAQGDQEGFEIETRWTSLRGYCRRCAMLPRVARDAGPLRLRLTTPLPGDDLDNQLDTQARYPGPAGGGWNRTIRLQRISDLVLPHTTVATREGLIEGRTDRADTLTWQNIPYVAPPTGENRLRAPLPAASRARVLSTQTFGPHCPQAAAQGSFNNTPVPTHEDCLSLNVWTPAGSAAGDALPVMLWIHGGGHVQGGAAERTAGQLIYDGSQFARRGVVFVSINYRLGALGYAAFRELIGEQAGHPAAGNYGLLDQIAALRWVNANIAQFGGDPTNVTIFGESAGGVSVCALLASPLAEPWFARAISQSGPCSASMRRLLFANGSLDAAVTQGDRIKQRLDCSDVDVAGCLRARSADEFVAAGQGAVASSSGESYAEIIDDHALDRSLRDAVRDGVAARKPFMIGVNQDETTTLIPIAQRPANAAAYEALVRQRTPLIANAVLLQYPASAYTPVWQAWTAINSDVGFICPAARAARDHAARGNPVHAYYLTQSLPDRPELGAFHALDIGFLFGELAQFDAGIQQLARDMKDLWVTYAIDGVPRVDGLPAWPLHPSTTQAGLELRASGITPRLGYRDDFCGFWAQFVSL